MRRGVCAGLALIGSLAAVPATAAPDPVRRPVTAACVLSAARLQRVPAALILGILKTEGGQLGAETRNTDGSFDLGPMQINDRTWLGQIARLHFHGDMAQARQYVRDDGCYNIHIGTWIFKQNLVESHGDYRMAVGYYNSHDAARAERYVRAFIRNLKALIAIADSARR